MKRMPVILLLLALAHTVSVTSDGSNQKFKSGWPYAPEEKGTIYLHEPKIAGIQLLVGSLLADATALVDQAGQDGADLVLVPMGFADPQTNTGLVFQFLSPPALTYDIYIVAPILD